MSCILNVNVKVSQLILDSIKSYKFKNQYIATVDTIAAKVVNNWCLLMKMKCNCISKNCTEIKVGIYTMDEPAFT